MQEALDISKQKFRFTDIAEIDYKIAERQFNIEKAKLSPSASINYSKSENSDYSSTIDKLMKKVLKPLSLGHYKRRRKYIIN